MLRYFHILFLFASLVLAPVFEIFAQEVPVVVHIVSEDPDKITDLMVEKGIEDLNEAFSHQGRYASLGPGHNTGIRFCLARKDPNGGNTKGITRTKSVLGEFDRDIEDLRMKGLVSWDPSKYCNIWLVDVLKTEIFPTFECGLWKRRSELGYATYPPTLDFSDGVVITTFGSVLAHNMGHYLGLLHTFFLNNCENRDCSANGDRICDTPPSNEGFLLDPCGTSKNSCVDNPLDPLAPDLPDLTGNFMTYNACTYSFTQGQAARMKSTLSGERSGLLWPNRCDPACTGQNVLADFTRDNWFPAPGQTVTFSNRSSQGSNFQWYIDGVPVSTGSSMSHAFPATGKYAVTLKVNNGDPNCFGAQTDSIIVTCGVMARYFPDKRYIASRDPILVDEVVFTNRSVPLTADFEWWLGNNDRVPYDRVSTDKDLRHAFKDSGDYIVRLVAKVGTCTDTTLPFKLRVDDPAVDLNLSGEAVCVDNTKVRVRFQVCNNGYSTSPKGVPITFYDSDPTQGAAKKLDQFLMPSDLTGKCCIQLSHTIDVGKRGLDNLYAVINDDGTAATPFQLKEPTPISPAPNPFSPIPEKLYENNVHHMGGIAFKVSVNPTKVNSIPDQDINLQGSVNKTYQSASWLPSTGLSCLNCLTPVYRTGFFNDTLRFRASTAENCHDTAAVEITIPPWNDFKVTIDDVECHSTGNVNVEFTVCNDFVRGYIPKDLAVSFYLSDPSIPGSPALLGTKFMTAAQLNTTCASFSHIVPAARSGTLYALVNDIGPAPFTVPAVKELQERDYGNNVNRFDYTEAALTVAPVSSTVMRGDQVAVNITSPVAKPSSIKWTPDPSLTLSCTAGCPGTTVTVKGDGKLRLQLENRFSCKSDAEVSFSIFPPDLQIKIDSAQCFSQKETILYFTLITGNGYDTIPSGLPVAFFEGLPNSGSPRLLSPSFRTPTVSLTPSASYSHVISTPDGSNIFAVVNQTPTPVIPTSSVNETDLTNNSSSVVLTPFTSSIQPGDTTVQRLSSFQLKSTFTGGRAGSYEWQPSSILSCTTCPNPVVTLPYSSTVILQVRNQFSCLAKDTILIKTYSEGKYQIPNAFTPNGDGLNDVLYMIGNREIAVVRDFSVYDRYGQRVFQMVNGKPNDPKYGWNGTRNGIPATNGTYAYTFVVELKNGNVESLKGLVTVIR